MSDKAVPRDHGYHALRVKQVVREAHDASSFVLDIPDDLRETFRYRPGQFCTFRVRVEGDEHLRSYSMSSAPETDRDLTVTVKRVAGGRVSNWFLDELAGPPRTAASSWSFVSLDPQAVTSTTAATIATGTRERFPPLAVATWREPPRRLSSTLMQVHQPVHDGTGRIL